MPEQALIMAPIIFLLLLELEGAPREKDLGSETTEMEYSLTQPTPAPNMGCCEV